MYTPSPFADAVGSFRYPVTPPTPHPLSDPTFQVCINQDWLPFCAGALKQLLLQSTWRDLDDTQLENVQGRVFDLISAFGPVDPGCGVTTPSKMCLSGTFADSDYGYKADTGFTCLSSYIPGTGFVSCDDGAGNQVLNVSRVFTASTQLDSYEFSFPTGLFAGNETVSITWSNGGTVVRVDTFTLLPTDRKASGSTPLVADEVQIFVSFSQTIPADSMVLTDWKLCYTGTFPLSIPPDTFTHVFDFTVSNGGFSDFGVGSVWVAGIGWTGSRLDSQNLPCHIHRAGVAVRTYLHVAFTVVDNGCGGANCKNNVWLRDGGSDTAYLSEDGSGGTTTLAWDGEALAGEVILRSNAGSGGTFQHIISCTVRGLGIDPY